MKEPSINRKNHFVSVSTLVPERAQKPDDVDTNNLETINAYVVSLSVDCVCTLSITLAIEVAQVRAGSPKRTSLPRTALESGKQMDQLRDGLPLRCTTQHDLPAQGLQP